MMLLAPDVILIHICEFNPLLATFQTLVHLPPSSTEKKPKEVLTVHVDVLEDEILVGVEGKLITQDLDRAHGVNVRATLSPGYVVPKEYMGNYVGIKVKYKFGKSDCSGSIVFRLMDSVQVGNVRRMRERDDLFALIIRIEHFSRHFANIEIGNGLSPFSMGGLPICSQM